MHVKTYFSNRFRLPILTWQRNKWPFSCLKTFFKLQKFIGHFWVPKPSLSKRGQEQNLSNENEFYSHENKNHFHVNGFALSLACGNSEIACWPFWACVVSLGRSCIEMHYGTALRGTFVKWLLRSCAGNLVKVRPTKTVPECSSNERTNETKLQGIKNVTNKG